MRIMVRIRRSWIRFQFKDSLFTIAIPLDSQQYKKAVLSQGNRARHRSCSFGLKFADNITTSLRVVNSFESQASELQTYRRKTEFNAKWPF